MDRSIDIAPGGRDDHWVLAVRLELTVAEDLVGNSSFGDSGVNPPMSLQRIDPISLRDPAARASFRELLRKVNVESCGDPYQVTETWKRGFESVALQCFRQKVRSKKARKTWISEFTHERQVEQSCGRLCILRLGLPWCESCDLPGLDDDACQGPSIPGCGSCLCHCAIETLIKKHRQILKKRLFSPCCERPVVPPREVTAGRCTRLCTKLLVRLLNHTRG